MPRKECRIALLHLTSDTACGVSRRVAALVRADDTISTNAARRNVGRIPCERIGWTRSCVCSQRIEGGIKCRVGPASHIIAERVSAPTGIDPRVVNGFHAAASKDKSGEGTGDATHQPMKSQSPRDVHVRFICGSV
jgi:hypothetical protein